MSDSVGERHSDDEYLDAVREHEPASTREIAETVGVARQSADYRLRNLEEQGKVTSKKIGNSLAWHLADQQVVAHEIDPQDEFWEAETYEGEKVRASDIDDVLYGDLEAE